MVGQGGGSQLLRVSPVDGEAGGGRGEAGGQGHHGVQPAFLGLTQCSRVHWILGIVGEYPGLSLAIEIIFKSLGYLK